MLRTDDERRLYQGGNGHNIVVGGIDITKGVVVGEDRTKSSIRWHAENDERWEHHEMARKLYHFVDRFNGRFLDPVAIPGQDKLPAPAIGFEPIRAGVYAYYLLGKDKYGLEDAIVLNELYLDRPLFSVYETTAHELGHLKQQRRGKHPVTSNYHNKEFVLMLEGWGLHPMPIFGFHWRSATEPFVSFARELGAEQPPDEEIFTVLDGERRNWWEKERKKGKSTLILYECPSCGLKLRAGRAKEELEIGCIRCSREKNVSTSDIVLFERQE